MLGVNYNYYYSYHCIGTTDNLPVIETAVEFWTPEVDEAKDKTDAHKSEDWTKSKN